jgi:hypothetical protein
VTLSGLTLTGGQPVFLGTAGGISNDGLLTLKNMVLRECWNMGNGGAIANAGTLLISDTTLSDNAEIGFGFGSHYSNTYGGAVSNSGTCTILNSTISGNAARFVGNGGGIANTGTLSVHNSTIQGNTASGFGVSGVVRGGGIYNSGTCTITNCTISGNEAQDAGSGGGVYNDSGTLTMLSTILAGNTAAPNQGADGWGTFTSLGHNLIGQIQGTSGWVRTDLKNKNPMLGPLQENGGPTQTLALLPDSPAIDSGLALTTMTTDQRGLPSPQGFAQDIGAYEVQPTSPILSYRREDAPSQPTKVLVTFAQPMNPLWASRPRSFRLFSTGNDRQAGTHDDRAIAIRSARYNSASQTSTLFLHGRLPERWTYRLSIRGTPHFSE